MAITIGRRRFITLLGGTAIWPKTARAQRPGKLWRVGFLGGAPQSMVSENYAGFQQGMRELGYVEGRDLVTELRSAEGAYERLNGLAAELVRERVDVILTGTSAAIRPLQEATKTIPIIFVAIADPVGSGFVASLTHPTGNMTGLTSSFDDSSPKQLELVAKIVPSPSRIGLLGNPDGASYPPVLANIHAAAQLAGLDLIPIEARNTQEVDDAFVAFDRKRVQALMVASDAMFFGLRRLLAGRALRQGLPTMFPQREFVEDGGLMSYGDSEKEFFRRAAAYVDKIFKGAVPADLPVEQPTRFHLVINLTTAKVLGLAVPPGLLAIADEVIE